MQDIAETEELIALKTEELSRPSLFLRILYWTLTVLVVTEAVFVAVRLFQNLSGGELVVSKYINQLLMCVLAVVCLNIPVVFRRLIKVRVPIGLEVIVDIFIYAHFILGEIFRFYDHYQLFDKILHTTGGGIITLIGCSVFLAFMLGGKRKQKLSPYFIVLFGICFAMAIEYLWELVEFFTDEISYTLGGFDRASNMQRWKDGLEEIGGESLRAIGSGLNDSMMDMVVNVLGAAIVAVAALWGIHRRSDWFEDKCILSPKKLVLYVSMNAEDMTGEEFKKVYDRAKRKKERRDRRKAKKNS